MTYLSIQTLKTQLQQGNGPFALGEGRSVKVRDFKAVNRWRSARENERQAGKRVQL